MSIPTSPLQAVGTDEAGPILVVESDRGVAGTLVEQLQADGYLTELALTAGHARILGQLHPPEAVVLGAVDSPRGAIELLAEIRGGDPGGAAWMREVPVVVLGAGRRELDMLRAFEAGADDFMTRPARYLELRVRLRALLRRARPAFPAVRRLEVGPLQIDLEQRVASLSGIPIDLRRLEFELLVHLAADPERVVAKQELLRAVWGYRSSGSTRTVDSHASRLRCKLGQAETGLGQADAGRWVINVWGVGYRLR